MSYTLQSRLAHNSNRMRVLNPEDIVYTGLRGGVTTVLSFSASPIIGEAIEVQPGVSITRIEQQTWAIDVANLGSLYPPQNGDRIQRISGERFLVASCDDNEPPWKFVRSTRDRMLVMTKRYQDAS